MKEFNAFQAVLSFAGAPFLLVWLSKNPFPYATAALWVAAIAYLIGFVAMVFCVRVSMD